MRAHLWAGMHELATTAGSGAPYRLTRRIGEVTVSDMGVRHPWSLNAVVGPESVPDEHLRAAIDWLIEHDRGFGWRVSVPPALQAELTERFGLAYADELPLYAMPATAAHSLTPPRIDGVTITRSRDVTEVRRAYGGWMADDALAAALVSSEDVADPRRSFLVATMDGHPVGCAFVWWVARTGYLSGIGVLAEHRRRGIGRALTVEASLLAAAGADGHAPPDVVWMGATTDGAALYTRMGFTHVDDEVRLGPR